MLSVQFKLKRMFSHFYVDRFFGEEGYLFYFMNFKLCYSMVCMVFFFSLELLRSLWHET
jgi:hypothetical protein